MIDVMRCEWCEQPAQQRWRGPNGYRRYACDSALHVAKVHKLVRIDCSGARVEVTTCPTGFSLRGRMLGPR